MSIGFVTAQGGRYYTELARAELLHRRAAKARGRGT